MYFHFNLNNKILTSNFVFMFGALISKIPQSKNLLKIPFKNYQKPKCHKVQKYIGLLLIITASLLGHNCDKYFEMPHVKSIDRINSNICRSSRHICIYAVTHTHTTAICICKSMLTPLSVCVY